MKKLSRRVFITRTGLTAAGLLLSTACTPDQSPPAEAQPGELTSTETAPAAATATSGPTRTPRPTNTPIIPPTPKAYRAPDLVKIYPDVKSKVVRAASDKAWKGDAVSPEAVRAMLDRSITTLTGITEPLEAWRALFDPSERIAIKVNAFRNSTIWTHPELVKAVTDSLVEAGIPGEQITVFDYYTRELETAGFTVNKDGLGVRCYGTDEAYSTTWLVEQTSVRLSDILLDCDALINIPVLKSHMIAGMTFALKNHYGSVNRPDALHNMGPSLPGLNALPPIKNSTRLVIGDVLHACVQYSGSFPYWSADTRGNSILMSYDPLALDMVGLEMLKSMAEEKQVSMTGMLGQCQRWIDTCRTAGIGACDPENYELVDI